MWRKTYVLVIAVLLITVITAVIIKAAAVSDKHEKDVDLEKEQESFKNRLPLFEFLKPDGTAFSKYDLESNRSVIIVYFDPDCGLCEKSGQFFKTFTSLHASSQVIFTTSATWDKIKDFEKRHELDQIENITFLQCDMDQFFTIFKSASTPTYFIYNIQHQLVKVMDDSPPAPVLIRYIKAAQSNVALQ